MTVAVGPGTEQTVYEGVTVFFCSEHCRVRFEAQPELYSGLRAP
jgi:YHS domain-containing protein